MSPKWEIGHVTNGALVTDDRAILPKWHIGHVTNVLNNRLITWAMSPKSQMHHATNVALMTYWSRDQCCPNDSQAKWPMWPFRQIGHVKERRVTWPMLPKWQICHVNNFTSIRDWSREQCAWMPVRPCNQFCLNDRLVTWPMLPKWQIGYVTIVTLMTNWSRDLCCLDKRLVTWLILLKRWSKR